MTGLRVLLASSSLAAAGLLGVSGDAPVVEQRAARQATAEVRPAPVTPPAPQAPRVVERGDGRLHVVPGTSARSGTGPLQRYQVAVEGGLDIEATGFARAVERTLADPRSWGAAGRRSFQRVDAGAADLRVVLASPSLTDRLCAPLDTEGRYSCATEGEAVLNARRWLTGAPAYRGRLAAYRTYLVNHEVGHVLGRGHADCPGPGRLAPVMMQQTLGVGACRPSPWPFP